MSTQCEWEGGSADTASELVGEMVNQAKRLLYYQHEGAKPFGKPSSEVLFVRIEPGGIVALETGFVLSSFGDQTCKTLPTVCR